MNEACEEMLTREERACLAELVSRAARHETSETSDGKYAGRYRDDLEAAVVKLRDGIPGDIGDAARHEAKRSAA